ncbi:hypothetical protein CYMTET_42550 [Cymbomonas tetramitiformis]|uniref:NAD(P)-binding domain-containing protein n=1 Tax=Cymbomonas tetramitiformis TaxID=36881 RepID=A0AAE0F2I5_9CHLO|nr:hypothetical protein CYMTET_42550 [Cymbomonas tetramitiformis]
MTKTIALLGATGKVGGWILDEAMRKKIKTRALVRKPDAIGEYIKDNPELLVAVKGSSTDKQALKELINGVVVVICALGSPNHSTLVMKSSAEALVSVLESDDLECSPRVIWISTIGVNEATSQARKYGVSASCCPSCSLCCGYGLFGCMLFSCIIPGIVGKNLWADMGYAEDVIRKSSVASRTVLVRPTNMEPAESHRAFTKEWKEEGEKYGNEAYLTRTADDPPPNMWITRKAIAAFFLDCVDDEQYDGKAVSLFQGP